MGDFYWTIEIFFIVLSIHYDRNPYAHQPEEVRSSKQQQQNAEQRAPPFPGSQNAAKPGSGNSPRDFNNGFSPNRFNPQNGGPFLQREASNQNSFNRAPLFPALGGAGRAFDSSMAGPSSSRGAMFQDSGSSRQFDLGNMMAGQALLGAANLRQLEQALQARAQFMGAAGGMGGGMGRSFGFPAGSGALDFAASQLDPVTAAFARPFFPSPRQDSNFGSSFGRPLSAAINYDASVPQYRRPPPGEAAQPDPQYAMQYPFATAPYDPKMVPLGYAKPLKAVVVLTSPFGISGIFNLSQSAVDQPVEITGRVSGLRPGDHGIHIHTLGDLSRSCDSAGSHFNPEGVHHGSPEDVHNQPHAGDLGNIYAGDYGPADFSVSTALISLYPPAPTLVVGRTLVIHEKPDDLGRGGDQQSRETGNSGSRIACGIIGVSH